MVIHPKKRCCGDPFFAAASRPLTTLHPQWKSVAEADDSSDKYPFTPSQVAALQSIAFSALTLEYRMRRSCDVLGVVLADSLNCGGLFDGFWTFVSQRPKWNHKGQCRRPDDWNNIKRILAELATMRDKIAHARWTELLSALDGNELEKAKRYFNAVIDAMMLINEGIGYVTEGNDPRAYFPRLKLR